MIITSKNCLVSACEGRDHRWEFERPTLREIKRIEQATGLDVEAWQQGLNELGSGVTSAVIDACLALVDILHRRDGIQVPYDDIDVDLPNLSFELEEGEAEPGEGAAGETDGSEGKDPAPTPASRPPEDVPLPASESGPDPAEASPPRSWPIPQTSGATSA